MDDVLKMSAKDAILYVSKNYDTKSMYAIAKQLSNDTVKVHTIQISNYLKGTQMSKKVADRFYEEYEIMIIDAYDVSAVRRNYERGI